MQARSRVADIDVDAVTLSEALDRIMGLAHGGGGCVFTPNVDHIVRASRDPAFRAAYSGCALAVADGMPVLWAAALLGAPLPAKVSGSTLLPPLLQVAAQQKASIYFVGGRVGASQRVAAQMQAQHPSLVVAGCSPPTQALSDAVLEETLQDIAHCKPHLVLVSLAAPRQELWASSAYQRLGHSAWVCTGSAIDIAAGLIPRAPAQLSALGLEWAWRLAREPRRLWRRYLVEDPPFARLILRQWWQQHRS